MIKNVQKRYVFFCQVYGIESQESLRKITYTGETVWTDGWLTTLRLNGLPH